MLLFTPQDAYQGKGAAQTETDEDEEDRTDGFSRLLQKE